MSLPSEVTALLTQVETSLKKTSISYPEYQKRLKTQGPSYAKTANWGIALAALDKAQALALSTAPAVEDFGGGGS